MTSTRKFLESRINANGMELDLETSATTQDYGKTVALPPKKQRHCLRQRRRNCLREDKDAMSAEDRGIASDKTKMLPLTKTEVLPRTRQRCCLWQRQRYCLGQDKDAASDKDRGIASEEPSMSSVLVMPSGGETGTLTLRGTMPAQTTTHNTHSRGKDKLCA
jgi:hypothetical protein